MLSHDKRAQSEGYSQDMTALRSLAAAVKQSGLSDMSAPCVREEPAPGIWDRQETPRLYSRFTEATWYQGILASLVDRLPLQSSHKIMDVGCGTGSGTRLIAQRLDSFGHICGIDSSRTQIDFCESVRDNDFRISYRLGSASRLRLVCHEDLDGIVSFNAIHLIRDLPQFFESCAEQLKPGGFLGICTGYGMADQGSSSLSISSLLMRTYSQALSRYPGHFPQGAHSWSSTSSTGSMIRFSEIRQQLTQAGFGSVRIDQETVTLQTPDIIQFLTAPGVGDAFLPSSIPVEWRRDLVEDACHSLGISSLTRNWHHVTATRE